MPKKLLKEYGLQYKLLPPFIDIIFYYSSLFHFDIVHLEFQDMVINAFNVYDCVTHY